MEFFVLSTTLKIYVVVMAFAVGACFGSFLNCAAYRIVRGISLWGRSECPHCHHVLSAVDLIPIVGYLVRGRKCAYCKEPISFRYPLSEIVLGLIYVALVVRFGLRLQTLCYIILMSCFFTASITDLDDFLIPDTTIVAAILGWILFVFTSADVKGTLVSGLLGGFGVAGFLLVFALIFDRILGKESLGGGDLKMIFVSGLYLGIWVNFLNLILTCVFGLVFAFISSKRDDEMHFPLGPAIACATFVSLIIGLNVVSWYLGLLL